MNSATCIKIKTYAKILAFHVLKAFCISLCKGNYKMRFTIVFRQSACTILSARHLY